MRRTHVIVFLSVALAAAALPAAAQTNAAEPAHRETVQRLMAVTHVREMTEQSAETMLGAQIKQMPQLAPYANIFRDFYREQLNWAVLEPEFTTMYMEVFTEGELRELITFYDSPIGQKMLSKMPILMTKSNELTARRMEKGMPVLMQRLEAAMRAPASKTETSTKKP
jgi:uncharacterized protein